MRHYRLNILRTAILLMASGFLFQTAQAGIDKKFFEKAAETVWGMDLPQFNPNADLSDSIFQNQSANFIARYIGLTADYDNSINPSKGSQPSNTTKAVMIRRSMVKLNDAAAIDYFSDFTFYPPEKVDFHGYVVSNVKPAFGARIHKADGKIVDIDMNEAVEVTTGKKNKVEKYKIAIPGLVAGDVLEYFHYTDYYCEEFSMPDFTVNFLAKYPTHNLTLDCRTAPELALEYGAFNGAPRILEFPRIDNKNQLFIELQDIESLDEELPYFEAARQMPYMHIFVINHTSRLEFHPNAHRMGGIRYASAPYVMSDVAASIYNSKVPDKIVSEACSMVKNWKKTHPDATETEVNDAAWYAAIVALHKSRESISDRQLSLIFYKVLEKLDRLTDARIGVTTSREEVPIDEIPNYKSADYFVKAGDRFYFCRSGFSQIPGELPRGYDSEKYILYTARPTNEMLHTSAQFGNFPKSKATENTDVSATTVTINPDDPQKLDVTTIRSLSGTEKNIVANVFTYRQGLDSLTTFLGEKPISSKDLPDETEDIEDSRESAEKYVRRMWATDDAELSDYTILKSGIVPTSPILSVRFNGVVDGAVTEAGNNMLINVGRFIGKQSQLKGNERTRDVSIVRPSAKRIDTTITFEIPEGYELVESSLDDLRRSMNTRDGSFNTEVSADGSTVTIRVVERYPRSISPASAWPDLVAIQDMAHEFNSATLAIRRK